jgi:hypothetical protein
MLYIAFFNAKYGRYSKDYKGIGVTQEWNPPLVFRSLRFVIGVCAGPIFPPWFEKSKNAAC